MNDKKLGFALCGSFCTLERTLRMMAELVSAGWEIQPIMSPITYGTDTRFGTAEHWRDQVEALCGRPIWAPEALRHPAGGALYRQYPGQAGGWHHRYTGNDGGEGPSAQ